MGLSGSFAVLVLRTVSIRSKVSVPALWLRPGIEALRLEVAAVPIMSPICMQRTAVQGDAKLLTVRNLDLGAL